MIFFIKFGLASTFDTKVKIKYSLRQCKLNSMASEILFEQINDIRHNQNVAFNNSERMLFQYHSGPLPFC